MSSKSLQFRQKTDNLTIFPKPLGQKILSKKSSKKVHEAFKKENSNS